MNSKKCILYNRDFYLIIALVVFLYVELVLTRSHRNVVFSNKYIFHAVGPVFTFCIMTYLELMVCRYLEKHKMAKGILFVLLPAAWILLCVLSKTTAILLGLYAPYFAIVSALYTCALLYLGKKAKQD